MELWQLFGELHPKLVHFPLALLLMGLLFELAGLVGKSDRAHWAGKAVTVAGTVMLLFTFISGIYAEIWAGRALVPHHPIEVHELMANIASWGFVILAAWRLMLNASHRKSLTAYTFVGLGWYGLLILTAWYGGQLVQQYGAAVVGASTAAIPTLHDLNTLATRQTDLNLKYSEMMHHIFGYITLALAGSLLAAAVFPKHAGKLKWVGPTLLLLGGIFLFFFADLDLYALTDLRQFRDREVQLHKAIATILAIVGFIGLRSAWRKQKEPSPRPSPGVPGEGETPHAPASWTSTQAHLIAIMALIGGGMLFTHVHTVAPYANVAAGVYIAHVIMGLTALAIGASSLLGDAFPARRQLFAVAFAGVMLVESVLLLTYNEGLPWYIGYGSYNRWGAKGGTVAPYGDVRAELTFDNKSQKFDLYVLDRFEDTPVQVQAQSLDLLIGQGYQETAVTLQANADGTHFSATAPFMKDALAFSARLPLPVGPKGRMKMGYFDPWVTPVISAVPPNEVARFVCPMHEGIRKPAEGPCSLCGMPLVAIANSSRQTLHDPGYEMTLAAPSPAEDSSRSVTIELTPKKDGQVLRSLARVHEHLLHLIIVSEDLKFFDHVHPQPEADGTFLLPYTFPAESSYLLFADITPAGQPSQVFRLPLQIGADKSPRAQLEPSPARSKPLTDDPTIVAELIPSPRQLQAGIHTQLVFRLTRNGQPLTDLEPYIGAMGHCVIISEDTGKYLHSHPEQLFIPQKDARGGPEIAFHTRFPAPGRYKIWGQFLRGDKVLLADFVVDVAPATVPSRIVNFFLEE